MNDVPVSESTRVYLNFALSLEDGSEVDSNFGSDPVNFVVGDGSLLPGFERRLFGLRSGEEASFVIAPEDGFGQPQEDNVQRIARDQFEADADQLEPGMVFSFADAAGGELPGVVLDVGERDVTIDFNHPLAGRTLTFKVRIDRVEPAELH